MKQDIKSTTSDANPKNNFDALCQEFSGGSVYGLEYILEDFFQTKNDSSASARSPIDWFGLND